MQPHGESSFTMYRTDLFKDAGLEVPEDPTRNFIDDAARQLTDAENEALKNAQELTRREMTRAGCPK